MNRSSKRKGSVPLGQGVTAKRGRWEAELAGPPSESSPTASGPALVHSTQIHGGVLTVVGRDNNNSTTIHNYNYNYGPQTVSVDVLDILNSLSLPNFRDIQPDTLKSTSAKGKKGTGPPVRRGPRQPEGDYEGGTLVWAKAESYPWWPAVVFDSDHPEVPASIVQAWKDRTYRQKMKRWIVRFYDRTSSWQYLPRDKLLLLGEDEALDANMLAPQSVYQKWKSPLAMQNCRDAFRMACMEMETKSDDGTPDQDASAESEGDTEE
ncbi:hypothetical protein BKA70DRAFT_256381 [Coprinopsis sp. MPI-PUGE-AT-0042]|nr:hypothetical protein BKA70DRAFT_256381 [Coprinopsis sp. MPI-PUGE-AT-0042]